MANELVIVFKGNTTDALNKTNGLKSALSGFGSTATTIFKGATLAVGALALGIGAVSIPIVKMGIDFNAMKETAYTAFSTILGDGQKATDLMADLQRFAASTPFEFNELADATKKLLAFGIEGENSLDILRQVGDISSAIGAPIGEIAELYGKAHVQGRLFAEDINQLTGRGIPIIQELAKQFGVTDAEVKQLVEDGKIGFDNLETAFRDLTSEGGKFSGMMEAQSQTFAGQMSTMQDNFNQLAGELAKPIFEFLKTGIGDVNVLLGHFTEKLQAGDMRGALQGLASDILKIAGMDDAAANKMARDLFRAFDTAQAKIQSFWNDISPTLENVRAWFATDGIEALDTFFTKAREFEDVNSEWKQLLGEMGQTFKLITQGMKGDTEDTFPSMAQIIGGSMDEIRQDTLEQMTLTRTIFRTINAAIKGDWEQVFSVEIPNLLQDAFIVLLESVGVNGQEMLLVWQTTLDSFIDKVMPLKGSLSNAFTLIFQELPQQFFQAGGTMIQGLIDGLWSNAQGVIDALWSIIQQAIQNALSTVGAGENALFGGTERTTLGGANGLVTNGGGAAFGPVTIQFFGENAPRTQSEADHSGNLIVDALRGKGFAV